MTGPLEDADALKERLRIRLVAARVLAGFEQEDLAAELRRRGHTRGYSVDNIGLMERGKRPIQPQEVPVFAAACGVSPAFFSVDFSTLEDQLPVDPTLSERLDEVSAQQTEDSARLAQLEATVRRLIARGLREPPGEGSG